MLSNEEKEFIAYWEQNRLKEKKTFRQLLIGLPLGLVFTLPILVNFMSGWYKRADMVGRTQFNPVVLICAAIIIVVFFAIFSKRHKWEMNEQRYQELKARLKNEEKEAQ
ncbi:MAG: hypothetical protein KF862_25995 [Chitinophagaceae bacterium]|nr:hypothetical protein [Chitinophagaceae bacterium]